MPRPIPRVPPVITATRSFNCPVDVMVRFLPLPMIVSATS